MSKPPASADRPLPSTPAKWFPYHRTSIHAGGFAKKLLPAAVALWLGLLIACGGGANKPGINLLSITVAPPVATIAQNGTVQFTAAGHYSDGTSRDITSGVGWSSSNNSVATISATGLATGQEAGSTSIEVSSGGVTGSASLTVTGSVSLVTVSVSPTNASVSLGSTISFRAAGIYSDGSTQDLTSSATWTSSNPAIVPSPLNGITTPLHIGSVTISASSGSVTGSTTLNVTAPTVTAITISPLNPSVIAGLTQQFFAVAGYSDGSMQNVTTSAAWSSSSTSVASTPVAGLTTGLASGSATISASLGGVVASTTLTVLPPRVVSISVTPINATGYIQGTVAFYATATMTDGTSQDITAAVTTSWISSNPSVATVSNSAGTQGQATGIKAGTTNISALSTNGVNGNVISNAAALTIKAALLQSIILSPSAATISLGAYQQFKATGKFTDGSTGDLTQSATWISDNPAVAKVIAGQVTPVSIGTANITASQSGITSAAAVVTTDTSGLIKLQVKPVSAQIGLGTRQRFSAVGTFQNGSTLDVSGLCTWTSDAPAVATIGMHSPVARASSSKYGVANITATLGAISQTVPLTVSPATISSIAVAPNYKQIPVGIAQSFSAVGTFSDGTTQDLANGDVTWTSSDATKVSISTFSGVARAQMPTNGSPVKITATFSAYGNVSGSAFLDVSDAVLQSLTISPANYSIDLSSSIPYTAIGTYDDGSLLFVSGIVSWHSSDSNVATFTGNVATGQREGNTLVTATLGAVTSNEAALMVNSSQLLSITVSPSEINLPQQVSTRFRAIGNFQGSGAQDLTNFVTWTSDNTAVATISNGSGTQGEATTGSTAGTANILAVYSGQTGTATLIATGATLTSIVISPADPAVALGETQQFKATGLFTDGSTLDVTTQASWSSTNPAVAIINSGGMAMALSGGQTIVQASMNGQTGATSLTVR